MKMTLFAGLALLLMLPHVKAGAQAVPDTSLNRVLADTIPPRNAPVLDAPAPNQVAYDSLKGKLLPFQPNPKKSALYSAILPGAGQLYNRQYWKIPVVYAGVGASIGFIIFNSQEYQRYRKAYVARINDPTHVDEFTEKGYRMSDLQTYQNAYKKDLDLTILLTAIGYTLQVLDALTFAHLNNFDVSRNISLNMQPIVLPNGNPGFGLVMQF